MPSRAKLLEVIRIQTEIAKLGLDLGGMMHVVVERTLSLIDADGAAIELEEGDDMVYQSAAGIARSQLGLRLRRERSLSGLCVRSGVSLRCDDSESDPRVDREACRRIGLRSMIIIPLQHLGTTAGVLKAMSATPGKFADSDITLLELVGELLAASMYFATKYSRDNLFHLATHDELTGLANRALFMDRLRGAMAQCNRDQHAIAVVMVDMNGLKEINDSYGHRVGDAALVEFGSQLKAGARFSDTVARLGGDEFGMILTLVDQTDGVESVLQRIQAEMEASFRFEGRIHHLSASMGAAIYPGDAHDINELIDVADQRMYAIKQKYYLQPFR